MPFKKMSARELFAAAEQEAMARVQKGEPLRLSPETKQDKEADEATVYLYDAIGGWFGTPASEFVQSLNSIKAKTIHLRINSPGGSVFEAEAIQTAIQQHKSRIVAHIDGMAASAATYVAIAADEVEISDGAFFMIHNAWTISFGNAAEFLDTAAMLEKIDGNLVKDYARKTGQAEQQIRDWMAAETYFSATESLENGFVDRIFTPENEDEERKPAETKKKTEEKPANKEVVAPAARERALRLASLGF